MLQLSSLAILTVFISCIAFGQGKDTGNARMNNLSDEQVVEKIASQNRSEASQALNEAFKRGARIIPLLLKYRGDRRFYFGERLGRKNTGDFKMEPPNVDNVGEDETRIETTEVAALYLVSSIYFGSLEFAHSALLFDTNIPEEQREFANTQLLLDRAWESTERWVSELKEKSFDILKCKEKREPLYGSGVKFYGQ
jgi:hypothetical protein